MANVPVQQTQNKADESIESVRVRQTDGVVVPGFGILTLLEAHPKTGEGWTLDWHKVGVRASHPKLGDFGAWVIPFANITAINVR